MKAPATVVLFCVACGGNPALDPCRDAACGPPPPSVCRDSGTLLVFSSACDPASGECLYPAAEVPCPNGCEAGRCRADPADGFSLAIEAGQALCAFDPVFGIDPEELSKKARVTFTAGVFKLPRDQAVFELDLAEELRLGSDGRRAERAGAGRFWLTVEKNLWGQDFRYQYQQPFDDLGQIIYLTLTYIFYVRDGVPGPAVRRLEEYETGTGSIGGQEDLLCLSLCNPSASEGLAFTSEICLPNRDRISLSAGTRGNKCILAGAVPCQLTELTLEHGGEQRRVDDYFSLYCTCGHHCESATYYARIEPPLGEVDAVHLFESYWEPVEPTVFYYNDRLGLIHQQTAVPCE